MTKLSTCACALALLASPATAGPLHDAVKAGDIAQVKLLIAQGEDVNESQLPVGAPLHYAALSGNAEMAELLLTEGADVNLVEPGLGTPLKIAALKGNEAVAVVLIANGADMGPSGDGTTPLHAAAQRGDASMIELLIESGADVNARSLDNSGVPSFAPVHSAGQSSHFDIIDLLRAYGATGPTVKPVTGLLASANPSDGEEVFNGACLGCHSIEQGSSSRMGPSLWGVLGRKKADIEDFEPRRVCRRPFRLSHAAMAGSSSTA